MEGGTRKVVTEGSFQGVENKGYLKDKRRRERSSRSFECLVCLTRKRRRKTKTTIKNEGTTEAASRFLFFFGLDRPHASLLHRTWIFRRGLNSRSVPQQENGKSSLNTNVTLKH